MTATRVIAVHTFREAVSQPIYPLLLVAGAVILGVYGLLPFFTLGEDVVMFKAVGLDIVVAVALLLGLVAASRTVHDEIEDRTMLTLMSKPVGRGTVIFGKFLGLLASSGLVIVLLGVILAFLTWRRIPVDFALDPSPIKTSDIAELRGLRSMHLAGIWPQLALAWMQVGVLIAIAVLVSTRFGLFVSLPASLVLYLAGNLTPYLAEAFADEGMVASSVTFVISTVLPFLRVFDLTEYTIYGSIALPGSTWSDDPNAARLGAMWWYVLAAGGYFVAYVAFLLFAARLSFATRDLGGNEG